MTKAELNRDIKRLAKAYISGKQDEAELRKEFQRLYHAACVYDTPECSDRCFIILMRINLEFQYIPLHRFGLSLKLNQL